MGFFLLSTVTSSFPAWMRRICSWCWGIEPSLSVSVSCCKGLLWDVSVVFWLISLLVDDVTSGTVLNNHSPSLSSSSSSSFPLLYPFITSDISPYSWWTCCIGLSCSNCNNSQYTDFTSAFLLFFMAHYVLSIDTTKLRYPYCLLSKEVDLYSIFYSYSTTSNLIYTLYTEVGGKRKMKVNCEWVLSWIILSHRYLSFGVTIFISCMAPNCSKISMT